MAPQGANQLDRSNGPELRLGVVLPTALRRRSRIVFHGDSASNPLRLHGKHLPQSGRGVPGASLRDRTGLLFRSAGFLYDGRRSPQKMAWPSSSFGVTDSHKHSSHIIDDDTMQAAELILTMESQHLRDLTVKDRSVFEKTIPFKEAVARLDRPMSLDEFLTSIGGRDASSYFDHRWDVEDPYKRSTKKYQRSVGGDQGSRHRLLHQSEALNGAILRLLSLRSSGTRPRRHTMASRLLRPRTSLRT